MLIFIFSIGLFATLGGQVTGYFVPRYQKTRIVMFCCWAIAAICTTIVFVLNFQSAAALKGLIMAPLATGAGAL